MSRESDTAARIRHLHRRDVLLFCVLMPLTSSTVAWFVAGWLLP